MFQKDFRLPLAFITRHDWESSAEPGAISPAEALGDAPHTQLPHAVEIWWYGGKRTLPQTHLWFKTVVPNLFPSTAQWGFFQLHMGDGAFGGHTHRRGFYFGMRLCSHPPSPCCFFHDQTKNDRDEVQGVGRKNLSCSVFAAHVPAFVEPVHSPVAGDSWFKTPGGV